MKLGVGSLFFKIFLWFWATVIVTGVALLFTFILGPHSVPSQWRSTLSRTAAFSGTIAVAAADHEGPAAASAYVERLERETHLRACLFDSAGHPLAGARCETFSSMVSSVLAGQPSVFAMRYGMARIAQRLHGSSGRDYIYVTDLPAGPRAAFGIDPLHILSQWGVALLVSGFICYLLTLSIATPILRIRQASQRLAAGDLSTRAAPRIESRNDELGDLARDFNTMAARLEQLVNQLRQLITDVSHELRSPLARLTVALDLGRERKGSDPAFDQMENDLAQLNNLIERLLTLARLGNSAAPLPMASVNVAELLPAIVRNAEFEARSRHGSLRLHVPESSPDTCLVRANEPLLYSALENVIRNAVRYGTGETPIEIDLESEDRQGSPFLRLTVRDDGPGVPEAELAKIFQPFHRVQNARDRQSGGVGLGLAIAERVIHLHGGSICARNRSPHGLEVEILLPAAPPDPQPDPQA
ncbi:HAMP domain-containing protein [Acidobacteria bacterium AB60]|nr:HAMP domain-containing protein [Acidobacteria bacterium AB60]